MKRTGRAQQNEMIEMKNLFAHAEKTRRPACVQSDNKDSSGVDDISGSTKTTGTTDSDINCIGKKDIHLLEKKEIQRKDKITEIDDIPEKDENSEPIARNDIQEISKPP